jgi:hypothetical protein
MVKRQKRSPGGGRRPQGEFGHLTSMFSLRMPQGLREQLVAAAQKNGRSAAQELLRRLNESFGASRDRTRDPAIRAFCFLIAELADQLRWPVRPNERWQRNPFLFSAFQIGVAELLKSFEPNGEIRPPLNIKAAKKREPELFKDYSKFWDHLEETWKTPQAAASRAVSEVQNALRYGEKSRMEWWASWVGKMPDEFTEGQVRLVKTTLERTHYGMAQVREDLRLKPKPPKTGS